MFPPVLERATAGQHANHASPQWTQQERSTWELLHESTGGVRLKLLASRPGPAALQGVSRIQRRPLFGTPCRPAGGLAGFEPHRHRIATCTSHAIAVARKHISEPRPKAQVRLAAAACLHGAVALELVAGQTWVPYTTRQDCGTHCPGGTVHALRVRGTASAASWLSLHACSGSLGASADTDSETRLQDRPPCHPAGRRGRPAGWTSVARDKPPGNLMPRAALRRLYPSLPGPGPAVTRKPDPNGETRDGVWAQAVWPVSPLIAANGKPRRGPAQTGLAPRRPLRLDSDNWRATLHPERARAAQRVRHSTRLAATRMRATRTLDF